MAYKDKDKQREANRLAQSRRRKALAGMTEPGMTQSGMTERNVIPKRITVTDAPKVKSLRPAPNLKRDPDRPMLSQSQLNYIKMRKEQG
jgi:hypothetical protein